MPFPALDRPAARNSPARTVTATGQGRYRIIYEIRDNERPIIVVKVGHRRDVNQSG